MLKYSYKKNKTPEESSIFSECRTQLKGSRNLSRVQVRLWLGRNRNTFAPSHPFISKVAGATVVPM